MLVIPFLLYTFAFKIIQKLYSMTGTVKFFNESKGYGFITNDETEQDIFVHVTALNGITIQEGDKVNFSEGEGKKGKAAIDITLA
jgi:cold shock protein|tara:strand:- start:693 stop:947 length:255 start_codon:yes stop_codon:yes gene_type:complete